MCSSFFPVFTFSCGLNPTYEQLKLNTSRSQSKSFRNYKLFQKCLSAHRRKRYHKRFITFCNEGSESKDIQVNTVSNGHAEKSSTFSEGEVMRQLSELKNASINNAQTISAQQKAIDSLKVLCSAQQSLLSSLFMDDSKLSLTGEDSCPVPADFTSLSINEPFDGESRSVDRRVDGLYDARFHSTRWSATPKDLRILPEKIILVRHAESEGNVDNFAYTHIPDAQVPLTRLGAEQARQSGLKIKSLLDETVRDYHLFFYTSPYKRSLQTYENMSLAFQAGKIVGVQEEVQLREQDFGNFQDPEGKQREKAERLRFGRFFYRFPNGESGADVYDRITIFEDHMVRDMNAGRFSNKTCLVLVTHGLALRVFLMRWFHWTVGQFLNVYNPPNAEPLIMERVSEEECVGCLTWLHTKALYRLTEESMHALKGCTPDMCTMRGSLAPNNSFLEISS